MGKFIRTCFIIAIILIVLGIGLSFAGGAIGGMEGAAELVNKVSHGLVSFDPGDWKEFRIGWSGDARDDFQDADNSADWMEELGINPKYNCNTSGRQEKVSMGRDFSNLDFEIGGAEVNVLQSEDENFYVEAEHFKYFQAYVENGTLHLVDVVTATGKNAYVSLYVPENASFSQVEIELGAGKLHLPDFVADEMKLEIGAGKLTAENLQAKQLEIEVGAGAIELEKLQVGEFEGSVGMGSLSASGSFQGNVSAQCSMGNLELAVTDASFEDYNYDVECAMGEICIGDRTWNNLAAEDRINNHAKRSMELECAMGRLEVSFP